MNNGNPAPTHLVIAARDRTGDRGRGARIDEKGSFEINDLQSGTYEISIANASDIYLLDMAAKNAKLTGRSVTVSGASTAELGIVLGKGMGEIHGTAVREGKGLGGAMVLLIPANADYNSVLFRRDQSDSDGTFSLARVVPGKYSVVAIENGWDLEWSREDVLKPYLAKAEKLDVAAHGKYDIKVQVQSK